MVMLWAWIAGIVFLLAVFVSWVILTFNGLVQLRNLVRQATGDIDVQLKRRSNLVPNLVETVKGYASHENETLTRIAEYRAAIDKSEGLNAVGRSDAETGLTGQLRYLFAIAENYPNLKADQNFLQLQNELGDIEDKIEHARRYYNGAVRNLNNYVECFPSNFIAAYFGFRSAAFFQVETAIIREAPKVEMG